MSEARTETIIPNIVTEVTNAQVRSELEITTQSENYQAMLKMVDAAGGTVSGIAKWPFGERLESGEWRETPILVTTQDHVNERGKLQSTAYFHMPDGHVRVLPYSDSMEMSLITQKLCTGVQYDSFQGSRLNEAFGKARDVMASNELLSQFGEHMRDLQSRLQERSQLPEPVEIAKPEIGSQ